MNQLSCSSYRHKKDNILALVDNEPITIEDLQYSLEIEHRREDLSKADTFDISHYIRMMIDNKLLIQEAYRTGLYKDTDIQNDVDAFVLRESVVKLHNDKILKKISVTEEEMKKYYRHNYEKFFVGIIELNSEKEASDILEQLKREDNFTELADKYPARSRDENKEVLLTRRSMGKQMEQNLAGISPGEVSGIININDKFYIVKLLRKQEAPDNEFEAEKKKIKNILFKEKKEGRISEYLEYLRKKADIKIESEILSTLDSAGGDDARKKLSEDKRPIVSVNGFTLTVGELTAMTPPRSGNNYEKLIKAWIDRKLVDIEALNLYGEKNNSLKNTITRYRNELLKKKFIAKAIMSEIKISDKELKEYYLENKNKFLRPASYKIQQITVNTMEESDEILNSLKSGDSFSWLAKTRSKDSAAQKGGDMGWVNNKQLPAPASKIIGSMKPGDTSPALKADNLYIIVKLLEKKEQEVEDYDQVKDAVRKDYYSRQYRELFKKYIDKLKEDAQIIVYNDNVKKIENRFKR